MWLANGLKFDVICYTGYEINNCTFYTKSLDDKSIVQNSGVSLEVESLMSHYFPLFHSLFVPILRVV